MTAFMTLNPQTFYTSQGTISNPGEYSHLLDSLPDSLPELVSAIQGLMLHLHWAKRYGISLNKTRQAEANLRTVTSRLDQIIALSDTPLNENRKLGVKTVGTCRDFSLFLTAALRHQGVPARARAGFGTYFTPGRYEDHWVCEYWHAAEGRWVMVDAQLDDLQQETLGIDFNPLDMPQDRFVTGGEAWIRCRSNRADPDLFGIFNYSGLDFVKGNLIRDFLALNKIELLPWDDFKLLSQPFHEMQPEEQERMDRLAKISTGEDRDFTLLRAAFTTHSQSLLPDYFLTH